MESRLAKLKQISFDYLMLYPPYRKPKRESKVNYIKNTAELAASLVTGKEPVDKQLDNALNEMATKIKDAALEFNVFYELSFELREKAALTKSLKFVYAGEESKLFEHFHAVADLIICELAKTKEFKNKVHALEQEADKVSKQIAQCLSFEHGLGIEKRNKELDAIIFELAQLGIVKHINTARQHHLFDYLPLPTSKDLVDLNCEEQASYAAPIYLQRIYAEKLYETRYRHIEEMEKIDFEHFKQNAEKKIEIVVKETTNRNGQSDPPPNPIVTKTNNGTPSNSGVFSFPRRKITRSKSSQDSVRKRFNEPNDASQQGLSKRFSKQKI